MNTIERIVEPRNGVIDLHVDVPTEWEGKRIKVQMVVDETQTVPVIKPKSDLTRFGGKYSDLPTLEKDRILQGLDDLRNEWARDI